MTLHFLDVEVDFEVAAVRFYLICSHAFHGNNFSVIIVSVGALLVIFQVTRCLLLLLLFEHSLHLKIFHCLLLFLLIFEDLSSSKLLNVVVVILISLGVSNIERDLGLEG